MPMEPYYEVLKYYEAGRKSIESPAMLVTNVGAAASGVVSSLLTAEAGRTLDTLKPNITAYLGKNMVLAGQLRTHEISTITALIESSISNDYITIIDAMKAGIGQGVGGIHGSLYETLNGTNALMSSYEGLIQRIGIDPFISRYVNQAITPNIPDEATAWYMNKLGALTDDEFLAYLAQNGWDATLLPALNEAWTSPAPIGTLLDLTRRAKIDAATLEDQLRRYRLSDGMIEALKDLTVQYPEPYRLAEMHSKALISNEDYLTVSRIFGLPDNWSMMWSEDQMRYPDFTTALALLRRAGISEETFFYWMQRGQISPEDATAMLQLKDVIPPIQDLIRFAVREAYGDHSSEVQYPTMVDIAKKMGLTEEASSWYWYAHWDRIPVNLMFANYHRGLWDKTKLERMLKIVDVHPDDRQDIINVAYGVPSIREMGYGFDVGVYTTEDIKRFRRWGGLSPDDADKAAASMVAYRTEAERNSVRTELMYALGDDRIDAETFIQDLLDLNTPDAAIDLWVRRAELYRERVLKPTTDVEGRTVSSSEALTAFKLGLRDETWTREMLTKLFWTVERIDTAIERAKLEIEQDKAKSEEVKYRKLTLAQIKQLYTVHIINKEQMTTEYVLIGYSPDDAELLTEIYTREEPVEVKPKLFTTAMSRSFYEYMMFDEDDVYYNLLEQGWDEAQSGMLTMLMVLEHEYPLLRIQYENGTISGEDMVKELMKLEMPELNARALVKETYRELQIKRLTSERDLTKAEIIKGVKNQVLTPSQGAELLQGIGYDENEAWYILAINKVVSAGDPEGYWEMRKVTESYKKAKGEKYVEIPDEAIMLEKQIKQIKAQIDELKKTSGNEDAIAELLLKLNTLELAMKTLVTEKKLK